MRSTPIYKKDRAGRIRIWSYEVSGDKWRTITGIEGGTITVADWTYCVPKSQPTAEKQAVFEADAEYRKKIKIEYSLTRDEAATPKFLTPMLADPKFVWKDTGKPKFIQPKLDGIRCNAADTGLFTRTGEAILSCPHIFEEVQDALQEADVEFDGELYNHELHDNLPKISGLTRLKVGLTEEVLAKTRSILQYHVYDLKIPGMIFSERYKRLQDIVGYIGGDIIHLVPTYEVTSEEGVLTTSDHFFNEKYEGAILREDEEYVFGRTKYLQKIKKFDTAEFSIVELQEGNGAWRNKVKRVIVMLPSGETCETGIAGDMEYLAKLYLERENYKGKPATVRFQGYTPKGKLFIPVTIDIDRQDML